MKSSYSKGIIIGLLSGITWAIYTVGLYWILNSYAGFSNESNLANIEVGVLSISLLDTMIALCVELLILLFLGKLKYFLKVLFSRSSVKILPASILAGLFGIVPYAIASNQSVVASSITMAYPVVGAVLSYIVLKQYLNTRQWVGVSLTALFSVALGVLGSKIDMSLISFILSIVVCIGWGSEAIFGYKLMDEDIDPLTTIALRHFYSILLFIILLIIIISTFRVDPGFIINTVKSIDSEVVGSSLIPISFVVFSGIGSISYILWYSSMKVLGVAKAMILNVSYGVWTPIITTILGLSVISFNTFLLIVGVFISMALVVYERRYHCRN